MDKKNQIMKWLCSIFSIFTHIFIYVFYIHISEEISWNF